MRARVPGARAPGAPAPVLPVAQRTVPCLAWRGDAAPDGVRAVPEETAVALTYNGSTQAVMMATPDDLEDFAVGFSLTERLVPNLQAIESVEILPLADGIEARLWIARNHNARLMERRRMMVGPVGCGLCGVESLAEAVPRPRRVDSAARFRPADLMSALEALNGAQALHRATRAVHAAGFWKPGCGLLAVREDLGRHNAMDKLVGALVRTGVPAADGLAVVTSRVSVELVQKSAAIGFPVLVAVSAPTALAIRTAELAGITLVGVARTDGFEVFTRPERIETRATMAAGPDAA